MKRAGYLETLRERPVRAAGPHPRCCAMFVIRFQVGQFATTWQDVMTGVEVLRERSG